VLLNVPTFIVKMIFSGSNERLKKNLVNRICFLTSEIIIKKNYFQRVLHINI